MHQMLSVAYLQQWNTEKNSKIPNLKKESEKIHRIEYHAAKFKKMRKLSKG